MKCNVVIGFLGTRLDVRGKKGPFARWRSNIGECQQKGFFIDRLELVLDPNYTWLAEHVVADIDIVSPGTEVKLHFIEQEDPWDFAEIYTKLRDFANSYPFDLDHETVPLSALPAQLYGPPCPPPLLG